MHTAILVVTSINVLQVWNIARMLYANKPHVVMYIFSKVRSVHGCNVLSKFAKWATGHEAMVSYFLILAKGLFMILVLIF